MLDYVWPDFLLHKGLEVHLQAHFWAHFPLDQKVWQFAASAQHTQDHQHHQHAQNTVSINLD